MKRSHIKYIVIHCSATSAKHDVDISDVDRWHRQRGWRKVGYHFFVKRDGTVQFGRDIREEGAHAYGYNNESIGICMAGGVDREDNPEENFTDDQWLHTRKLVDALLLLHPDAEVVGHNDLDDKKDCPCFDVKDYF